MSISTETMGSILKRDQLKWPSVQLSECCRIVSGGTPKSSEASYWDGDILWATPKDLTELASKHISSTPRTISESGLAKSSATMLPAQSVLFSSRAPIGHVAINTVPMCTNQGFKSLVPDPTQIFTDYLYYWLRANKAQLQSLGNGATFKEISKGVISKVEIPLPPLPAQRRIAAILDKADALRRKRREGIAKLDQVLQSVFLEMFGDPVTNPNSWPISDLGEICDVRDGTHDSPKYVAEGKPLITSKNLVSGRIDIAGAKLISQSDFEAVNRRSKVTKGDILMPMIGTIGNPVLVESEPDYAIKNVALIRMAEAKINTRYLVHLLQTHYFDWVTAKRNRGGTQKFVSLKDLRTLPIPIPPENLQVRYAELASAIKASCAKQHEYAEHLEALFSSLQQRAFTGQL